MIPVESPIRAPVLNTVSRPLNKVHHHRYMQTCLLDHSPKELFKAIKTLMIQPKRNCFKNPNWHEVNHQLAINLQDLQLDLYSSCTFTSVGVEQLQLVVRVKAEDLKASNLTTLLYCLLIKQQRTFSVFTWPHLDTWGS